MPTALIVDDEPNVLYSLEKGLRSDALTVRTTGTASQAIEIVRHQPPDVVVLDVRLADMSGLDAFDRIREIDPRLPVIIITAYAATETAIEATKRGAFEYLLKPVDLHLLRESVAKALEVSRLRHVPAVFADEEAADEAAVDRIVGPSAAMQEVYKAIGRVAQLDVPVLIGGESGTGKELVARAIYSHSRRSRQPFLALNCAAIPEALLESELFGHERGAFTGADRRRIGKFEQAHGGTIFLDEIGDLPAAVQPKLLRLLQEQKFERLGGNETVQTDVRLIAATNRPLDSLVSSGQLREDLYYRLNVFTIDLPPLRERLEDLPHLVAHFLKLLNRSTGKHVSAVSPEALNLLEKHDWPGNVRELQSVVKYAFVCAGGDVLTADSLPDSLRSPTPPGGTAGDGELSVARLIGELLRAGKPDIYRQVSLAVDRIVLESVLRHVKGNQVQASELLGISRTTLRTKMRALGMSVEKQILSDSEPS
ncbi:MAG: sigma-54-dependent transcriptional regulator [Gemmataceae bacterium]